LDGVLAAFPALLSVLATMAGVNQVTAPARVGPDAAMILVAAAPFATRRMSASGPVPTTLMTIPALGAAVLIARTVASAHAVPVPRGTAGALTPNARIVPVHRGMTGAPNARIVPVHRGTTGALTPNARA